MPGENYYGGMDESAPDESSQKPGSSEDSEYPESETALLPKSILGGKDFKEGEEVVLKIVHLYDDEVEVQYAPEKPEKEGEKGMMGKPEMEMADQKLASMAQ